jgi:lipid-A-disaccharide synthase-like uncharacterized protein
MSKTFWLVLGFSAQALFFGRWLVQWYATEKKKKSTVPTLFWHLSLWGGLLLLAYAVYRLDPVFIVGQAVGSVIYLRNLYYVQKHKEVISKD